MEQKILTERQSQLLKLFFTEPSIERNFYLSGGTALSEYYLHHRISEDLDLFSSKEIDIEGIRFILNKTKKKVNVQKITQQTSFNRNLFFLHFPDEIIKTEFTYYPFEQIEQPKKVNTIYVDSLIDIAVNKADTIKTHPRSRDFIDLYLIIKEKDWKFTDLMKKSRIKFDLYVDPLEIAQHLLEVSAVKDFPKMLIPFNYKDCENYWVQEARKLEDEIIK